MHRPKEEIKTNPPNCGSGVQQPTVNIDGYALLRALGVTPKINNEIDYLRPCYVGNKKALFHKWVQRRDILPPSVARGGHVGGAIEYTLALVEFENGQAYEVQPKDIRFADSKQLFNQIAFIGVDLANEPDFTAYDPHKKATE